MPPKNSKVPKPDPATFKHDGVPSAPISTPDPATPEISSTAPVPILLAPIDNSGHAASILVDDTPVLTAASASLTTDAEGSPTSAKSGAVAPLTSDAGPQVVLTPEQVLSERYVASDQLFFLGLSFRRDSFRSLRDSLASQKSFAASPQLRDLLTWTKDGQRHRLMWKEDVRRADDLYKSALAEGNTPVAANIPSAVLSVITLITDNDCWLMADGAWRGRSDYTATFADIKLTCTGGPPPYPFLQQDLNATIANLEYFMKKSDGAKKVGAILVNDGLKKIWFRHIPFVVSGVLSFGLGSAALTTCVQTLEKLYAGVKDDAQVGEPDKQAGKHFHRLFF